MLLLWCRLFNTTRFLDTLSKFTFSLFCRKVRHFLFLQDVEEKKRKERKGINRKREKKKGNIKICRKKKKGGLSFHF
jgi:hypothetical protein